MVYQRTTHSYTRHHNIKQFALSSRVSGPGSICSPAPGNHTVKSVKLEPSKNYEPMEARKLLQIKRKGCPLTVQTQARLVLRSLAHRPLCTEPDIKPSEPNVRPHNMYASPASRASNTRSQERPIHEVTRARSKERYPNTQTITSTSYHL